MNDKSQPEYFVIPSGVARYIPGESIHEDEISLIELVRVLRKRKKLLIGTVATILALALAWIFTSKPIYESRSVLLIGQVVPTGQLETVQTLVQRLKEEYRVDDSSEGSRGYPLVSKVAAADKASPNTIEIVARAHTAAHAQAFLKQVVAKVVQEHKRLYDIGMAQQSELLETLEGRRKQIQDALSEAQKRLLSPHQDPATSGLVSLESDQLTSQLSDLDKAIMAQRIATSELQSRQTTEIREATLPQGPVKPKPVLYLAIACILGLVFGGLLVFVAEFSSRLRAADAASA